MALNLSSSLAGLSLITGENAFSALAAAATFESRAVRLAKAQFTTPDTTPPWKQAVPSTPFATQVSNVKRMTTIIDKAATGAEAVPDDVQTAFTTYKALDRLRLLAESAAKSTTSDAERKSLQTSFAKGLGQLQGYLTTAPSDKLDLSFGLPTRRAETVKISTPNAYATTFPGVASARDAALPNLTGQEQFSITLTKPGVTDTVTVDLSTSTQPPTLDSVAAAINAAIQSVPSRDLNGNIELDAEGEAVPRWKLSIKPEKTGDKWGLKLNAPSGIEEIAIDEIGAKDALVVATGQTALDAPTKTSILRFDDAAGAMTRKPLSTISAYDRIGTERAALIPATTKTVTVKDVARPSADVAAPTDAKAITTDAQGNSYVVGTTRGELGVHRADGGEDLFLTKLNSEGKVLWQRTLGSAGTAQGAAVTIAPDGGIIVAGTVNGGFDGATTDGDMMVARFNANGDETFATVVRAFGADEAKALAVGADGAIYVGGKSGAGDAFVARINSNGTLAERRTIDTGASERIDAMAIGADGNLLAVMSRDGQASLRKIDAAALANDLGSIDLGTADARAIAVAADGSIAVGGATRAALGGTQVNATGGGRDGFVARIDAGLSGASVTYLATGEDDQVDSLAFMDGELYAGGRTTGAMNGTRQGAVDGFISRIDPASGAIASTTQFGQTALRTEPVRISAAPGGTSVLGSLGLARGTLNPATSGKLVSQTSLRTGDEFSLRVEGGKVKKITIAADETLTSLAAKVRAVLGAKGTVSTPKTGDTSTLRIEAKAGNSIELIAGSADKDALAKLGIEPQRLSVPAVAASGAPKVQPGGTYGLALTDVLDLSSAAGATAALGKIKQAISTSQTAYRSLYWDDGKASLVEGYTNRGKGGVGTARVNAQLANYQAALDRLNTTNLSLGF